MTPDIEQLCREALEDRDRGSPGPWRNDDIDIFTITDGGQGYPLDRYPDSMDVVIGQCQDCGDRHVGFLRNDDAAFAAAARTREPLLAKALLEERKETERLRAEVVRLSKRAERPAAEYVCTQCSATMRSWQDFPEYQHVDCGGLVRLRARIERDAIRAQLTAMTAARDELVDWATAFDGRHNVDGGYTSELLPMFTRIGDRERFQRIAELRAVGKERP